ncbi:squalene/phytoene synthase family protein [Pararhodobacter oceanensis]|uniref:squalene/phytoene synthase family protein n=1 Tax=Pararhodobacter oceanensis TaxID=2172121 RepID=UPI003A9150C4
MSTHDIIAACAAQVEIGDPDRFLATMAAPPVARPALLALYAFNLEVARAPWVTKEPLLAQMRLQFWRDVLQGEIGVTHDTATALLSVIETAGLDHDLLMRVIDAREAEIGTSAAFADEAALWRYLEDTAGALLALAVQALGGEASLAAQQLGAAQGMANYLMAVPALEAAGRLPLPDGRPQAVASLAREGLARYTQARRELRDLPKTARPALAATWRTARILKLAAAQPMRVGDGALAQSEFSRRGSLLWQSLIGY